MTGGVASHVGLCVRDLAAAERFYVDGLGFTRLRELSPPDGVTSRILRISRPVGLTAVYLGLGSFVLELMQFDRPAEAALPERRMTDPGLTHVSIAVDDVAATAEQAVAHGGEVLAETDISVAVIILDPDGQVIELVANSSWILPVEDYPEA